MSDTTLEEARRCPKCNQQGVLVNISSVTGRTRSQRAVTYGAKLHTFQCQNNRCIWYGQTCRIVQVNPDGSIPPALVKRDKEFPRVPDMSAKVNAQLALQLELEKRRLGSTEGSAEVIR